jgi:hypothetical protein
MTNDTGTHGHIDADLIHSVTTAAFSRVTASEFRNGLIQTGHNGPYDDPETPVRNTSHWLVTLAFLLHRTSDARWKAYIEAGRDFLLSKNARPYGFTFHHRTSATKNSCNGLIGAAWCFEGLNAAASALSDSMSSDLAAEVFGLHPFDQTRGLWHRVEIDGSVVGIDPTFNHQLWFAATAAGIEGKESDAIRKRVHRFLDALSVNFVVGNDGLIGHFIRPATANVQQYVRHRLRDAKRYVRRSISSFRDPSHPSPRTIATQTRLKWIGYHHFCLYAFAMLKEVFPLHEFWNSRPFARAVKFILSAGYRQWLQDSRNAFGFGYNAPGFELPYILRSLTPFSQDQIEEQTNFWEQQQLTMTWCEETRTFCRNTRDAATLTARIYEATRKFSASAPAIQY